MEQLISQAATLLERGIASRSEWQNLYERYFVTYLEVKEFDDLDAIHAEETLHGFYALPQNSAETDAKVQEIIRNGWVKTVTTGEDISSYANAQMNSADEQLTNADFRKNYEQCNVGFRRRRTESARRMNVIKAIGFTQPGAAYNYAERMVPIKARFTIDFNDAINRMRAIKIGLKKTYNYEMKVIDDTSNPFDNALLSIRDAMEWLVKFTSQEQNYVLAVSVKSTARDAWDSGLSDDKISGVWKFRLNNSMFPQQLFVRLRGLALSVETEDQRAIFQALIKVPPQGEVHYFDAGADTQIDQTRVPPVRIGRVQRQDSVRAPDVVGTVSLQNVSPIGEWELAVTAGQIPLSNWSHPNTIDPHLIRRNAQIEDVVLYLYLAVRAST